MLIKDQFDTWLRERGTAIIDGALATELEARGCDLNHPLWSAKVLKENPDAIREVHRDYFLAGADIAITASYQATTQGLEKFFGITVDEGKDLIKKSVYIAQEALQEAHRKRFPYNRQLLVAGSVGPFGAYLADGSEYRGDYTRTVEEFQTFHRPRIQALLDTDVDLLALETMPNLVEIEAIVKLLNEEFPKAIAWLSCTARDVDHLSDGTPWKTVLDATDGFGGLVAIGINCVPMDIVTATLKSIGLHTRLPLLCYPNSGETWNAETKTWQGVRLDDILPQPMHVGSERPIHDRNASIMPQGLDPGPDLAETGARLIGGCCRTGPAFIQALKASCQSHPVDRKR